MNNSDRSRARVLAACLCVASGCPTEDDDSALAARVDTPGLQRPAGGGAVTKDDPCPAPEVMCDGRCVDPGDDPLHCGGCGVACEQGEACVAGSCVVDCPFGQIECGGTCLDLAQAATGARDAGEAVFEYTGGPQLFVVPTCVARITVELWGAQGGPSDCGQEDKYDLPDIQDDGGRGGRVEAMLDVVPGTELHVYVGGKGRLEGGAGFNGGGPGGQWAGGGGGATDVRIGGQSLFDRVLVAGGGGGGQCGFPDHGAGGDGGGLSGEPGSTGQIVWEPGGGGTQYVGGAAGDAPGLAGAFGQGGGPGMYHVAGGGGGWFGGGGAYAAGGGGGSSYHGGLPGASTEAGVRIGHGRARIVW